MKIAFDKLKSKVKISLMLLLGLLSLGLIIFAFCIDNDLIKIVLGSGALILLFFLFMMLIWYYMYKEKFSNKVKYQNLDENKQVDLIVEYPKVLENHFLRYVYIEGLTLTENLDKLSLGEEKFIYVYDVDNKYDNEALALFYNEYKIGYFYKNGKFRDLFRKCKSDKDYKIITKVCHLDLLNNKIKLKIGFYKTLESEKFNTINISIKNNNYDYLKVGYWLNVNKIVDVVGKTKFIISDIYGKELATIENKKLETLEEPMYAKINEIADKIELIIYEISK